MVRLAGGATISDLARDLGVHRSTIQEHRDALLAIGGLVKVGNKHAKGPAYAELVAVGKGAGADRYPPPNPTATPWVVTDGRRVFEVLSAPVNPPMTLPGFVGTKLTGRARVDAKKRRDHRYVWTLDGRTFDLLLMESPTAIGHGFSLQLSLVRPAPLLSGIVLPGEDKEAAWDRFTLAAVQAWARLAGLAVSGEVGKVRRSRPVSLALPRVVEEEVKFRSRDVDADATPEPGTVEVRTEQLKEFLETGPEAQASAARQLTDLAQWRSKLEGESAEWRSKMEGELAVTRAGLEDVRVVSGKAVQVLREVRAVVMDQVDALVAIAQTEAASLTPPKRVLSPDSGVDVS